MQQVKIAIFNSPSATSSKVIFYIDKELAGSLGFSAGTRVELAKNDSGWLIKESDSGYRLIHAGKFYKVQKMLGVVYRRLATRPVKYKVNDGAIAIDVGLNGVKS